MDSNSSSAINSALAKVGRNLHRFQVIEALLRGLLPSMRVSGTFEEIQASILAKEKELRNASLGTLANAFRKTVDPTRHNADQEEHPETMTWSFALTIEQSPDRARGVRSRWKRLVEERNHLVHRQLLEVNFAEDTACAVFAQTLDEQFARLEEFATELRALASARKQALEIHQALIESGEFERHLKGGRDDA